ncbi:hypothetical protein [Tabrizicola sp.]|uniref:hypothetical protein n=1 Tax=Tabrizicola sp. TaxID=2005166 RepID=UPI0026348CFA|nr:hypothetical protein [Tabrizicola sp.]MDM7931429.1 hypothetical protein [Tabrizicola sp.]
MTRRDRRFLRQFDAIERAFPPLRGPVSVLRREGWWVVRLPLALILIAGGLLWFLPLLGIWMLPVGLLLLAVDLPRLRGPISAVMIRSRHRIGRWRQRRQARKRH